MAHLGNSGVQGHSAGCTYPYIIVCHGGFPTADNEYTAEVLGYDASGKQGSFGHWSTYKGAEEFCLAAKELDAKRGDK